ncbi:restriction endonuclease [Candidatus Parcubacteria bacterium]|nr:MAG: restriction endonuclease [Candidatus Parcubacteria bacterium]
MNLFLDTKLARGYKNQSQKIRVMTEHWVNKQIFCPSCGNLNIDKYDNNKPVADFFCANCGEDYELKSKKETVGIKIVDGAYRTMLERLTSGHNPNFFLLNYNIHNYHVLDFFVIPKHFFVPGIIEKRKPLAESAQRAGWVGCNILLHSIPQTGKIFFVKNKVLEPKNKVLTEWKKTLFLREEKEINAKGWLLVVMACIEKLGSKKFSLDDIYAFEDELSLKYPENHYAKDKIRQQLQILRDKNYLKFLGRGQYQIV